MRFSLRSMLLVVTALFLLLPVVDYIDRKREEARRQKAHDEFIRAAQLRAMQLRPVQCVPCSPCIRDQSGAERNAYLEQLVEGFEQWRARKGGVTD